jgi:hypothetical protein
MDSKMQKALEEDGEKLRQLTGEDHGPAFLDEGPCRMADHSMEVLWQLFRCGPTWDGDIVSKTGRDKLIDLGMAKRTEGWSYLTETGVLAALSVKMNQQKEKEIHLWNCHEA